MEFLCVLSSNIGCSGVEVPEAGSLVALAGPHLFLGMGVGTVDAALMPLLAALVDARHVAAYGAVYAIAQAAVALAYFVGETASQALVYFFHKQTLPYIFRLFSCYDDSEQARREKYLLVWSASFPFHC